MPLKLLALLIPASMLLLQLGVTFYIEQYEVAVPYICFIVSFYLGPSA